MGENIYIMSVNNYTNSGGMGSLLEMALSLCKI